MSVNEILKLSGQPLSTHFNFEPLIQYLCFFFGRGIFQFLIIVKNYRIPLSSNYRQIQEIFWQFSQLHFFSQFPCNLTLIVKKTPESTLAEC